MDTSPPADWPNSNLSKMVRGPVHHWHVQSIGTGPTILLLHGAGGSTHSFRHFLEPLSAEYHVLAPDLPGHGYTRLGAQQRSGLPAMAEDVWALCETLGHHPDIIIGHSAGAAVALELARVHSVKHVIGINPALSNFAGLAGLLFPALAKVLAAVPFTGRLFSGASSRPDRIKALIEGTGSELDEKGLAYYQKLVAREQHVKGALAMMAQWSLTSLLKDLPLIETPVFFITGGKDGTVPPSVAEQAAEALPNADVVCLQEFGHLVHEEAPHKVLSLISERLIGLGDMSKSLSQ